MNKTLRDCVVCRQGIIKKINNNNTYDVEIIGKMQYGDNRIEKEALITCNLLQNHNTKGFKNVYNVNDAVLVLFTDFNYKNYNKGEAEVIIDIEDKFNTFHNINNGIIIGIIDTNKPQDGNIGFYINNTHVEIKEGKIVIKNDTTDLATLQQQTFTKLNELIDTIKALYVTDPQSGSPLTFTNAATLDAIKAEFDNIKNDFNSLLTI